MGEVEHLTTPQVADEHAGLGALRGDLRRLESRDWQLWLGVSFVTLLLLTAIASLTLPVHFHGDAPILRFNLLQNVRGLVGLVLLFDVYTIYQHVVIKRMRARLTSQAEALINVSARASEMENLATLDPLTGLHNRRLIEERLVAEVARFERYMAPLAAILFDLDDFKHINDRYGHAAGDMVLKEFASRLKKAIRGSDVAARIGGDEFLVLLSECGPGLAPHVIARMQSLGIEWRGGTIPFTCSSGCADYRNKEPIKEFIERADQALYENKRSLRGSRHLWPK